VRLDFEAFSFDVAILTIVMAWGRILLRIMPLLPKSMIRLGRFRARLTCLLLGFPNLRLLMSDLRTVWPDMSKDTTMIACRLTLFAEMLLERLCKFKIEKIIWTSNFNKCVWIVCNKILNAELKETNILLTKWKLN
jgi:hypothetical protein